MKKSNYGYIEFIDIGEYFTDGYADQCAEIRKPTPAEREEIILNLIRDKSGRTMRVNTIAEKLAVSDRVIQKHLKNLEDKGLIKRVKHCNKLNRQRANIIEYIGPNTPRTKSDLTLEKLYDPDNPCGVRDWHWDMFKFISGYYTSREEREEIESKYELLKDMKEINAEKRRKIGRDNLEKDAKI